MGDGVLIDGSARSHETTFERDGPEIIGSIDSVVRELGRE